MQQPARPVHLNLLKIRLPIAGIMSIIHRATGVVLFLALPWLIYLLDQSLVSEQGFAGVQDHLHSFIGVLMVFGLMWSLAHHFFAGIRYLLIDIDRGVEKEVAEKSALAVTIAGPVFAVILTWGLL